MSVLLLVGGGLVLALPSELDEEAVAPASGAQSESFGFGVIVRRPEGAEEIVSEWARILPGSRVRFELRIPKASYLAVVGLDSSQAVSIYVPGTGAPVVYRAGRRRVPSSPRWLDETVGHERIVALLCPRAVKRSELLEAARQALREAGADPARVGRLGLGCSQRSVLLEKRKAT